MVINNMKKLLFNETPIYIGVFIFLIFIMFSSILLAVTIGSVNISIENVYKVILYKVFNINSSGIESSIFDIVWFIRLPRIILAALVGMGLSICGVVMQAIVKNSLADPYILGISSGASLGATLSIMLGIGVSLGSNYVGISAFIGAFIVSILVLFIANINGRPSSTKLLLAGMALSTVCSSFSSFIIYLSNNKNGMQSISYWLLGSVAGAKWENIYIVFPLVIASILFFISQYRTLNLMLLGDEVAITLGKDINRFSQIYLLITSIIIGFIVYSSGMIGFVGLIIPHIVRILFGTNHKVTLLISPIIGGIFLIWSDVLSRIIIPGSELPIGIITSIIGGPCFIYLICSKSYGFGGDS